MVERLVKYVNDLKADGIYLNSRSHSGLYSSHAISKYPGPHHADRFGFGKELVKEYKKRYGIDITKDPRFDYKDPKFAPKSIEVENWRKLRGEYFLTFYREVKKAIGNKILILSLPLGDYMGSSGGNIYVDHEKIIKEKLGDILVLGVSSGFVPIGQQRKLGYLSSEAHEANFNVPTLEQYTKRYGELAKARGIKLYTFQHNTYTRDFQKAVDKNPYHTGIMFQHLPLQCHPEYSDVPGLRPQKGIFSVEAIVKPTVFGGSGRVLSKYAHSGRPSPRGWELYFTQDRKTQKNNVHFRAFLRYPKGNLKPAFYPEKDVNLKADIQVPLGEWCHIGGTIDMIANKMYIYVNGKEAGSVDIPAGAYVHQNTNLPLKVGVYAGDATYAFRGLIDSFRISNKHIPANGKVSAYTGKEAGTTFFVDFNKNVQPVVNKINSKVSYDMTPVFKDGRKGRKAIWFNDDVNM